MNISTKQAVIISWSMISLVVIFSITLMISGIVLSEKYDLPAYVSIPVVFAVMLCSMIFGFKGISLIWVVWAYCNVTDVYELQKAAQLSGFGYYSVDDLKEKHPEKYRNIMKRFDEYVFVDDPHVPSDTIIYNRKVYQSYTFILFLALALFAILVFAESGFSNYGTCIFIVPFVASTIYKYTQLRDRLPQITLNEHGIQTPGITTEWVAISNYEITQGKTSCLTFEENGEKNEIALNDLFISKLRLNHLLYIYNNRDKIRKESK